jgi:hypothetical protein
MSTTTITVPSVDAFAARVRVRPGGSLAFASAMSGSSGRDATTRLPRGSGSPLGIGSSGFSSETGAPASR